MKYIARSSFALASSLLLLASCVIPSETAPNLNANEVTEVLEIAAVDSQEEADEKDQIAFPEPRHQIDSLLIQENNSDSKSQIPDETKPSEEVPPPEILEGPTVISEKKASGYTLQYVRYVLEKPDSVDGYELTILQVENMCDEKLQERINASLFDAQVSWVKWEVLNSQGGFPQYVYLKSRRYLSFMNNHYFIYYYPPGHYKEGDYISYSIMDFITIDLSIGERVFLNDLIDASDGFVNRIRQPGVILATSDADIHFDNNAELLTEWVSEMADTELYARFIECSKSMNEVASAQPDFPERRAIALVDRDSFYVEKGKLVLVFVGAHDLKHRITLEIDSIEDFLLVEKWG